MDSLKDEWKKFGFLIGNPWIVFLLLATIALGVVVTVKRPVDVIVVVTLTVIMSLTSSVLGGLVTKRWSDLTEEKVIRARGQLAVRSLKLLWSNITALEERVREYLRRLEKSEQEMTIGIFQLYLEEIEQRSILVREQVLSAIENWTDIVPEADIRTQIGLITEKSIEVENLTNEVDRLKRELDESKDKSEQQVMALREKLRKTKQDLAEAREELRKREIGAVSSLFPSGSAVFSGHLTAPRYRLLEYISNPPDIYRTCSKCGDIFIATSTDERECPKCRSGSSSQRGSSVQETE